MIRFSFRRLGFLLFLLFLVLAIRLYFFHQENPFQEDLLSPPGGNRLFAKATNNAPARAPTAENAAPVLNPPSTAEGTVPLFYRESHLPLGEELNFIIRSLLQDLSLNSGHPIVPAPFLSLHLGDLDLLHIGTTWPKGLVPAADSEHCLAVRLKKLVRVGRDALLEGRSSRNRRDHYTGGAGAPVQRGGGADELDDDDVDLDYEDSIVDEAGGSGGRGHTLADYEGALAGLAGLQREKGRSAALKADADDPRVGHNKIQRWMDIVLKGPPRNSNSPHSPAKKVVPVWRSTLTKKRLSESRQDSSGSSEVVDQHGADNSGTRNSTERIAQRLRRVFIGLPNFGIMPGKHSDEGARVRLSDRRRARLGWGVNEVLLGQILNILGENSETKNVRDRVADARHDRFRRTSVADVLDNLLGADTERKLALQNLVRDWIFPSRPKQIDPEDGGHKPSSERERLKEVERRPPNSETPDQIYMDAFYLAHFDLVHEPFRAAIAQQRRPVVLIGPAQMKKWRPCAWFPNSQYGFIYAVTK